VKKAKLKTVHQCIYATFRIMQYKEKHNIVCEMLQKGIKTFMPAYIVQRKGEQQHNKRTLNLYISSNTVETLQATIRTRRNQLPSLPGRKSKSRWSLVKIKNIWKKPVITK